MWKHWKPCALLVEPLWKTVLMAQKVKHEISTGISNYTSKSIPRRMESRDSSRYFYINAHNSIIHNSQKMETTQTPIDG